MEFSKAWTYMKNADLELGIIYNELLQFSRYLNKENTKILDTVINESNKSSGIFRDAYFEHHVDNNGRIIIDRIKITKLPANYGPSNLRNVRSEAGYIYTKYKENYFKFSKLIKDTADNQPLI